jgi:Transposase DDE domain
LNEERDLPTLGGAQTYRSEKEVFALVDLSTFIVSVLCLIDDRITELGRLRERGPAPTLFDSEVLTIEIVGEFLGIDEDTELFAYFRRHYAHFFPNLRRVHRTTFTRQTANLWKAKELLWQRLLTSCVAHDPTFAICDSMPLPACSFARAYRCRRFKGEAAFGKDILLKQTFYGFRVHLRICWPGVITRFSVAPANAHDLWVVPELTERTSGLLVGDRNYHSPKTREVLAGMGIELLAQYSSKKRDPHPKRSALLSRLRYRIDTVFSQLTERYSVKRVWARDLWHLASRLLSKVLSHTVAFLLNHQTGNPPLQLSKLLI